MTNLLDFPDELLIEIALHLPPSPGELLRLGSVSRRLHAVSLAPSLWVRLCSAAGITLDLKHPLVVASEPPGRWEGRRWVATAEPSAARKGGWLDMVRRVLSPFSYASDPSDAAASSLGDLSITGYAPSFSGGRKLGGRIPVHWPTLYRTSLLLRTERNAKGPHAHYSPERELRPPDSDDEDEIAVYVWPHHVWILRDHKEKIYTCQIRDGWLITGSRDSCVNIYKLPELPLDGNQPEYGPDLVLREKVAVGSVTYLDFDFDTDHGEDSERAGVTGARGDGGRRGLLVTSTIHVRTFDLRLTSPSSGRAKAELIPRANLQGIESPISGLQLHGRYIAVMAVDGMCRLYPRDSRGDAIPLRTVYAEGAHLLSLNSSVLLAGETGGIFFDTYTGRETGRFERVRQGRVASLDRRAGYASKIGTGLARQRAGAQGGRGEKTDLIAFGTSTGSIEVYDRRGSLLLSSPESTRHLVRHVLLDPDNDTVISAGYDGRVSFWNLSDGRIRRAYDLQAGPIFGMARDGTHLVVTTQESVIVVTYGVGLPYAGLLT